MKRVFALGLVILALCSIAGCSEKAENTSTYDEISSSVYAEDETTEYITSVPETATLNTTETTVALTKASEAVTESTDASTNANVENSASQIEATEGHTHSYAAATFKATCTKAGYSLYSCHCGASYESDYVDALGHKWGSWETVKEATTESEGKKQRTCDRCGKVESKAIDKVASPYDARYYTDTDLLAERILYYINQYRSVDASQLPRMKQFADLRAIQLSSDFSHNESDRRAAAEQLQYGEYVDLSHWNDPEISGYWQAPSEAITMISNCGGSIDDVAKEVADTCYGSSGHWRYIGHDSNVYISIGVYVEKPNLYVCVTVGGEDAINYE